jgi:hypothetical protein
MDANYTVGWVERSDTHQSKHHRAPSVVGHPGMMAMGIAALNPSYAGLKGRELLMFSMRIKFRPSSKIPVSAAGL